MVEEVIVTGNRYLVYNARAAARLRAQYRLCGTLHGPQCVRELQNLQDSQHGGAANVIDNSGSDHHGLVHRSRSLPLELPAEMVHFASQRGWIRIVALKRSEDRDSIDVEKARLSAQLQFEEQWRDVCKVREEKRAFGLKMKRVALEKKGSDIDAALEDNRVLNTVPERLCSSSVEERQQRFPRGSTAYYACEYSDAVFCSLSATIKLDAEQNQTKFERVERPCPSGNADFHRRCKVFEDLWERGLYVMPGIKFGSTFTAYQGPPSKVHANYMIKVVDASQSLSPVDLIAMGRLSTSVNKVVVLASVDADGCVSYSTMQWDRLTSNPPRK